MSAHESSDGAAHAAHAPPGIPEVRDEAGDTPSWVPKLGVVLGVVFFALVALALR